MVLKTKLRLVTINKAMDTVDSLQHTSTGAVAIGWHRELPFIAKVMRTDIPSATFKNNASAIRQRIAVRSCDRSSTSVTDCFKVNEYCSLREALIKKRNNFATFRDELFDKSTLSVTLAINLVHRYYLDWLETVFFNVCNGMRMIKLTYTAAKDANNRDSVRGFVRFIFNCNANACLFLYEWTQRQYDYYDHVLFGDMNFTSMHTSCKQDSHYRYLEHSLDLARSAGIVFSAICPNFDNISICRLSPNGSWHLPRKILFSRYNKSHIGTSILISDAYETQAQSRDYEVLKKRTRELSATVLVLITFKDAIELPPSALARLARAVSPVMLITVDDNDKQYVLQYSLSMRDILTDHRLPVEASVLTNQQRLGLYLHGNMKIFTDKRAVFEIVESGQDYDGIACKLKRMCNYECAIEQRYRLEAKYSASWKINTDTYVGGYVRLAEIANRTPINGVASLDVESLYPSIMSSYNLSPDTIVPSLRYALGGIGLCTKIRLSNEVANKSAAIWVDRSKQCCLIRLIKRLLFAKKKFTSKRLKVCRQVVKIATNTVYGSLSRDSIGNRFFGMVICSLGRKTLQNGVHSYIQRYGSDSVLYCDTDSIFLKLNTARGSDDCNVSGSTMMSLAKAALDYGNKCISRCMRLPPGSILLKLEFLAKVIVFMKMKSYAYVTYEDNEVVCRGHTTADDFTQVVCGSNTL
uniref:DNA-directed DNA polymerase n=1 Tax=Glypta fumiferanae TaxID=389681 RepID=A0A0F6QA55_9HYME|nr:DNA polymerase domain [Glypta fumiferanae]